MLRRIKQNLIK